MQDGQARCHGQISKLLGARVPDAYQMRKYEYQIAYQMRQYAYQMHTRYAHLTWYALCGPDAYQMHTSTYHMHTR
jgi:hypothetical protein